MMFIGLRFFSVFVALVGIVYALAGTTVLPDWHAEEYGSAVGAFSGRYMAWLVIAIYSWMYAAKYRKKENEPSA